MKKFMIDSNVIIEFMKGSPKAIEIIDFIKQNKNNNYYIAIDTLEEILYVLIKHFSKKSYWELKSNPEIVKDIYKTLLPLIKY